MSKQDLMGAGSGRFLNYIPSKPYHVIENEKGNLYRYFGVSIIGDGEHADVIFTTPPIEKGYIRVVNNDLNTNIQKLLIETFENPTYVPGTDVTNLAKCINRNYEDDPDLTFNIPTSVSDNGTLIYSNKIYGTGTGLPNQTSSTLSTQPGSDRVGDILKPNTTMYVKLTNDTSNDGEVSTNFYWFQRHQFTQMT